MRRSRLTSVLRFVWAVAITALVAVLAAPVAMVIFGLSLCISVLFGLWTRGIRGK